MKTLLKLFSLNTLREYIAKASLGAALWSVVKLTVSQIEKEAPELPGEEKFKLAAGKILEHAKAMGVELAKRAMNEAIEFAVRLMKG